MLKKIIDLVFYSNLWIALCALAMALQTQLILNQQIYISPLVGLIFFASLFLYAIHRIVGISKLDDFLEVERYAVIAKFKHHITIYAILAAIGGAISFWFVPLSIQLSLIIPGIISMGYVLPFLGKQKRLRDLDHIKIYLIAIVWSWVTVLLPAMELNQLTNMAVWMMAFERSFFVFAITLPFDIRDLKVDTHSAVKTIPAVIGIPKTKILAVGILFLSFGWSCINFVLGTYSFSILFALLLSVLSTAYFSYYADQQKHDYYYTGLLDGTMIIQFLLVYLFSFF